MNQKRESHAKARRRFGQRNTGWMTQQVAGCQSHRRDQPIEMEDTVTALYYTPIRQYVIRNLECIAVYCVRFAGLPGRHQAYRCTSANQTGRVLPFPPESGSTLVKRPIIFFFSPPSLRFHYSFTSSSPSPVYLPSFHRCS